MFSKSAIYKREKHYENTPVRSVLKSSTSQIREKNDGLIQKALNISAKIANSRAYTYILYTYNFLTFRKLRNKLILSIYFFFVVGMDLLFIALTLLMSTQVQPTRALSHINYGVMFEPDSMIKFSNEWWLHSYVIRIPSLLDIPMVPRCHGQAQCRRKNQLINNINKLRRPVAQAFNETMVVAQRLFEEPTPVSNRKKKGLFDFIGSGLKFLFGTSTDGDVNQLRGHINNLQKGMKSLNTLFEKQQDSFQSYAKTVNQRFDNVLESIEVNQNTTIRMTMDLANAISAFEDNVNRMTAILVDEIGNMAYLQQHANDLTMALIQLAQGQLSPLLISTTHLKHTIEQITNTLRVQFNHYELVTVNEHFYYQHPVFTANRISDNIIITIKFPIASPDIYHMYKVHTFPVLTNNSDASSHATQLLNASQYFVIDGRQQKYTELSQYQTDSCKGLDIKICNFQPVFSFLEKANCLANIFFDNKQKINKYCDFRYLTHEIQPHFKHVGGQNIIVYNMPKIIMNCQNGRTTLEGCKFCIVNIPCGCSISNSDIIFQNLMTSCNNTDVNPTIVYPINLPILHAFFNNSIVDQILANTTYQTAAEIILPEIDIYRHKLEHTIAADHKLDLSLKTIATQMKTNSTIYKSLTDAYLDGAITHPYETTIDYKVIMLIISFTLTIINTITMLFMFRKFKTLTTLCALARPIKAMNTFNYQPTSEDETPNVTNEILKAIKIEHVNTALCAITIILLILLLIKLFYPKPTDTKVLIEISNGFNCTMLQVFRLPLCQEWYEIKYPDIISDITIEGFLAPKLTVNWPDFQIRDIGSDQTITAPQHLNLLPWQAYRIRSIIKGTFILKIRIEHNGLTFIKPIQPAAQPPLPPYINNMDDLD